MSWRSARPLKPLTCLATRRPHCILASGETTEKDPTRGCRDTAWERAPQAGLAWPLKSPEDKRIVPVFQCIF